MTSEVKRPVTFQLRSSRNPTAGLLSVYQGNQKIGIRKPAREFLCFSPALYLSRNTNPIKILRILYPYLT